jgi:hypothetical protein
VECLTLTYTICSNHKFNNERKSVRVTYNNWEWNQRFVLTLPEEFRLYLKITVLNLLEMNLQHQRDLEVTEK